MLALCEGELEGEAAREKLSSCRSSWTAWKREAEGGDRAAKAVPRSRRRRRRRSAALALSSLPSLLTLLLVSSPVRARRTRAPADTQPTRSPPPPTPHRRRSASLRRPSVSDTRLSRSPLDGYATRSSPSCLSSPTRTTSRRSTRSAPSPSSESLPRLVLPSLARSRSSLARTEGDLAGFLLPELLC